MSWSRSSSRTGRRSSQSNVFKNEWLVVSSLKTPMPEQPTTGRARSASVRPRLTWTKRPESAMSIRSYDRAQQNRTSEGSKPQENHQNDDIILTMDPNKVECHIIYRHVAAREANPERINLDRRNFTSCPVLQEETRLRLLNLENNAIKEISNLNHLPNLIFLDLYNNQIRHISGLDCLPSLRVLMLGRNLIKHVDNLSALQKLDVLDLHSNLIENISGIEALIDLRVLNLAGNTIADVENLSKLASLTELNLRRNNISQIDDKILSLSTLSRLFLSHNRIVDLASIRAVASLQSLAELSLDGNPVADGSNPQYRSLVLGQYPKLKVLDGHRINADERRLLKVLSLFSPKIEGGFTERTARDSTRGSKSTRLSNYIPFNGERLDLVDAVRTTWMQRTLLPSSSKASPSFHEFLSKKGQLCIFGPCLEVLMSGRYANIVSISFHYIDFNCCSSYFVSVRDSLPLLKKLSFSENDLHTFYQLDTLSVFRDLNEIEVANNPINDNLPLYRPYLIFRLPAIQKINSAAVEPQECETSLALFDPLKSLWRTSSIRRVKGFCQPSMAKPLQQPISETVSFYRQIATIQCEKEISCEPVRNIIDQTIMSIDCCKLVDEKWSEITTRFLDECFTTDSLT